MSIREIVRVCVHTDFPPLAGMVSMCVCFRVCVRACVAPMVWQGVAVDDSSVVGCTQPSVHTSLGLSRHDANGMIHDLQFYEKACAACMLRICSAGLS